MLKEGEREREEAKKGGKEGGRKEERNPQKCPSHPIFLLFDVTFISYSKGGLFRYLMIQSSLAHNTVHNKDHHLMEVSLHLSCI